ncbi:uncharacterized protein LOC123550228 [Mercenaria mercenaria]|uniref:uncharacterized protein LOC123550228 n=1 Tax=Mercenaria mercenaria TaxID=6596 RepID=UPI00234EAE0E|nr:uncharacterized protein LOC123550228 [Mercenaria mercenaria]
MVRSVLSVDAKKLEEVNAPVKLTSFERKFLNVLSEVLKSVEFATTIVQKRENVRSPARKRHQSGKTTCEVERYLNEPCIHRNDDPLKYWSSHSKVSPGLAELASKYLTIPCTSAPVERLFSVADTNNKYLELVNFSEDALGNIAHFMSGNMLLFEDDVQKDSVLEFLLVPTVYDDIFYKISYKTRPQEIEDKRREKNQEKVRLKGRQEREKFRKQTEYSNKIMLHRRWQSETEVDNMVASNLTKTAQTEVIRFRKDVLLQVPDDKKKTFNFTTFVQRRKFRQSLDPEDLKLNLKAFIRQAVVRYGENQQEKHIFVGRRVRHWLEVGEGGSKNRQNNITQIVPGFPDWFIILYGQNPAVYRPFRLGIDMDSKDLELLKIVNILGEEFLIFVRIEFLSVIKVELDRRKEKLKMALNVYATAATLLFILTPGQCHGPTANTEICLKVPFSVDDCYAASLNEPISPKAAKVDCLQRMLWYYESEQNLTAADLSYFSALSKQGWRYGHPHPKTGKRTRQEYRTLTDIQRKRFHIAFQNLYRKGILKKYALLHRIAVRLHHGGASFNAWHRVLITYLEEELRREDKTVSLPYVDLRLDHRMDNPVNSFLWSKELLGNANGDVVTGFCAYWKTFRGNLWRNYGRRGQVISPEKVEKILTRCHNEDISFPLKTPGDEKEMDFVSEYHHNAIHNWVGGDMGDIDMAASDPVFYMVHCFLDMYWEKFRNRQKTVCGVNPETDYPLQTGGPSHGPNDYMTGFDGLKNIDGLKNFWIEDWFNYEDSPLHCKTDGDCRSRYLYCRYGDCVSHSRRTDYNPGQYFNKYFGLSIEPFEPKTSYVPKRTVTEFEPASLNDGRTIESAKRDARNAMSSVHHRGRAYSEPARTHPLPQASMAVPQAVDAFSLSSNANNNPPSKQKQGFTSLEHRLAKYNKLIRRKSRH